MWTSDIQLILVSQAKGHFSVEEPTLCSWEGVLLPELSNLLILKIGKKIPLEKEFVLWNLLLKILELLKLLLKVIIHKFYLSLKCWLLCVWMNKVWRKEQKRVGWLIGGLQLLCWETPSKLNHFKLEFAGAGNYKGQKCSWLGGERGNCQQRLEKSWRSCTLAGENEISSIAWRELVVL